MPHAAREKRAARIAVAGGVSLLVLKFAAYWMTGSAAILSDALESIVNVLASLVGLYAIIKAHEPADPKHPYGHGKIEFFSAGFEGGMILLAAVVIVGRVIHDLIERPPVEIDALGMGLITAAMLANGGMGLFLIAAGRRNGSIALEADGKHLLSDAITSVGVVIALLLVWITGWTVLDPLAALGVAVYIAFIGVGLLKRAAAGLMDAQDVNDERDLTALLDAHVGPAGKPPQICSYHKLRHRHSGRYHWVDFHIMVPARVSVAEGHAIASAIEYEIEQMLGEGNATAHIEPCGEPDCESVHRGKAGKQ